jgi:hypothetical protein
MAIVIKAFCLFLRVYVHYITLELQYHSEKLFIFPHCCYIATKRRDPKTKIRTKDPQNLASDRRANNFAAPPPHKKYFIREMASWQSPCLLRHLSEFETSPKINKWQQCKGRAKTLLAAEKNQINYHAFVVYNKIKLARLA